MALGKTEIRCILMADGHLVIEGNETVADLREALEYLWLHRCPSWVIPPGIPVYTYLSRGNDGDLSRSNILSVRTVSREPV